MEIYFLRHGEAGKKAGGDDSARPLTEEGIARMEVEAAAMTLLHIGVRTIVSSPYLRARQTAEIVARKLRPSSDVIVDTRLAPGFGPDDLAEILSENLEGPLMLVGHEPDFSMTISACIGGGGIELKKGGLARMDTETPGSSRGTLVLLIPPRVLAP
jgi:phosphohistidine phosphatase